jgi:predicted CoA-substrate-specific enzyme activase
MDSRTQYDIPSQSRGRRVISSLLPSRPCALGIDVGSTSSDLVWLDEKGKVLLSDYRRTMGRPVETVQAQLGQAWKALAPTDITLTALTGSAGRTLAELLGAVFVNEVSAQAKAAAHLYPELKQVSVIEMGGQDSKLIFLQQENGRLELHDFAINTVCAAGTGSFLDQQAQRLGVNIEDEFGRLALKSAAVPRMAGRCSVFAKSDMIHLQQQATPICDIIAGLCLALARNLKSNLGCGRDFPHPIIFTGGVAANIGVVRAFEEILGLKRGELRVPAEHFFTGAIGAVLVAREKSAYRQQQLRVEAIDEYLAKRGSALTRAPRRQPLAKPSLPEPKSIVHSELLDAAGGPLDAYLGVDVGSISTNVVVMDPQRRVLSKAYLMTAGKPLEAIREGLRMVGREVEGKVKILGAATTGSGRYLTGDFIGADIVINEITAQAAGAAIVNPKVDTIFEIGGQDSKYISLENGVVVDFEMNHACAAGTGSFLEEQAQRLGINIKDEFAALASQSEAPIKLGERCTVFMESDLLSYQQQGAQTADLVAGLSYSIVANYLDRVVGRRRIGDNICFQGGTAFNKAVWSAFEQVTAKPIMVPDHHEVTGALGAASIAAEHVNKLAAETGAMPKSTFRGFENLIHIKYTVESFTCEHCANNCEIKKVQLPGAEPLYYGSRCDRYNLKKKTKTDSGFGAFRFRKESMLGFAHLGGRKSPADGVKAKIAIPRALLFWQQLPLFSRFFEELGFSVLLSRQTDKDIIRKGVELVTAQTCFPVKVAYGHIADLLEQQPDYIFLPSIVSMTANFPLNKHNNLCPYVQSLPYQVRSAFADKLGRTRILTLPMRFGEGDKLLTKSFVGLGEMLGAPKGQIKRALKVALAAQQDFDRALQDKGKEILNKVGPDGRLFVLISRPYNGCDPGVNLQLPKKLAEHGVDVIPMDMLRLDDAPLCDEQLHKEVYWTYGQKILRAAEVIRTDPRLFAIYLSNFSCGPDSFLLTFFKDVMGDKPCLQLEFDEHSADAGVITRIEAFLDSLKHYEPRDGRTAQRAKPCWLKTVDKSRTLYIPYMGDAAYGVAAAFRSYGQPAEVIPLSDEDALIRGRRFTTGKECLPCAITTGDMVKLIEKNDPAKLAFFMPGGSGPCRFGMYNCMHRLVLKQTGAMNVPVVSPNQDDSFYAHFRQSLDGSGAASLLKDIWIGACGLDLLNKLLLRLRPFAHNAADIQKVYNDAVSRYVEALENKTSVAQKVELMRSVAENFAKVEMDYTLSKPRIGIVGEIYVRSHPFANSNIIARLEELGAACDLASLAEWIYYTNCTRTRMGRRRWQLSSWFANIAQDFVQHRLERALAAPLEEKFGPLVEGSIEHVLNCASDYIHDTFEGEAVLSVGKMVEYHHQGFGGVVNVMPFTCMPSTIVSTQTTRISADCDNMPILNISFDGQEDPTLTTRLEAFVEQVRRRKTVSVTELVAVS